MKAIVIYKSKTGFTKKYAEWICEELKCDIGSYDKLSSNSIADYDFIIYGGGIYAGKVGGLKKIKSLLRDNSRVRLVVFATGATPAAVGDSIDTIWKSNFSEDELNRIPHFYMQSGISYEKMGFLDRLLMKVFTKMLSKKEDKSPEEVGCEQSIAKSHDISSKEYIKPLIQFIKEQ